MPEPIPFIHPRKLGLDADRVGPKLWVGSYNENDALISRAGFTHVFRVAKELRLCEFPLDDAPLTLSQIHFLDRAVDAVIDALRCGGRVLVTCQMGINRSALVAALVLVRHYGLKPTSALAEVRTFRRAPIAGWKPLTNQSFVEYLLTQRVALKASR